jgi:hypothetical protein
MSEYQQTYELEGPDDQANMKHLAISAGGWPTEYYCPKTKCFFIPLFNRSEDVYKFWKTGGERPWGVAEIEGIRVV